MLVFLGALLGDTQPLAYKIDSPTRPVQPEYPYTYDLAKQLNALASKHQDYGFGAFGQEVTLHKYVNLKHLIWLINWSLKC